MKRIILFTMLLIGTGLYAEPLEKSKKVCLDGNAKICAAIGVAYHEGLKGVTKDLHTAQHYFTKACNMNDGFGCYALGNMYLKGNGVKQDMLKGLNTFIQACDNGYIKGCEDLKYLIKFYEDDYLEACADGNNDACYSLAIIYSRILSMDDNLTMELFKKSCGDGSLALGCYNAGLISYKKNNLIKAESFLSKACKLGSNEGCASLGDVYANEKYTKHDDFKAVRIYEKPCNEGNFLACNNLGLMVVQGRGSFKDYSKAKKLFEKACDGGEGAGCYNLGLIHNNGLGVLKDSVKAEELNKKACAMGYQTACLFQSKM